MDAVTLLVPVPVLSTVLPHFHLHDLTQRAHLAVGFLRDLIAAARGSALIGDVLVVSPDLLVVEEAGRLGARGVETSHGSVDALLRRAGIPPGPCLVSALELPCIDSLDLTTAVTHLQGRWRAVHATDLNGPGPALSGSREPAVLSEVVVGGQLEPAVGSALMPSDLLGMRCRVQSPTDLQVGIHIGLGKHSARACKTIGLLGSRTSRAARHPAGHR